MIKAFGKRNWTILILFGLIGQIAWSVENMYFNVFVFDKVAPDLSAITLMVQLSGVAATVTTLIMGALSDKTGNRRTFIAFGYIIWGVSVAAFGFLSAENVAKMTDSPVSSVITLTLALVIIADCVMTVFGSTANDAAFNAWVTDNTEESFRGKVEGVLAVLPLAAMLIVAGGFGMLVEFMGYQNLFLVLGIVISLCGVTGAFVVRDSDSLKKNGTLRDIVYGFKPSVVKSNPALYVTLLIIGVYGVACQIFMPYMIIYMETYLGFTVIEYSVVFGLAIVLGGAINVVLGPVTDKLNKAKTLYIALSVMSVGLACMFLSRFTAESKTLTLIFFGISGFIMITGYILVSALCGALVRDYTPSGDAGKLQGVRMVFSVLIPMLVGPMLGNAVNKAMNVPLPDSMAGSSVTMTTQYIPAPEIFLLGAVFAALAIALVPVLLKFTKKGSVTTSG